MDLEMDQVAPRYHKRQEFRIFHPLERGSGRKFKKFLTRSIRGTHANRFPSF